MGKNLLFNSWSFVKIRGLKSVVRYLSTPHHISSLASRLLRAATTIHQTKKARGLAGLFLFGEWLGLPAVFEIDSVGFDKHEGEYEKTEDGEHWASFFA